MRGCSYGDLTPQPNPNWSVVQSNNTNTWEIWICNHSDYQPDLQINSTISTLEELTDALDRITDHNFHQHFMLVFHRHGTTLAQLEDDGGFTNWVDYVIYYPVFKTPSLLAWKTECINLLENNYRQIHALKIEKLSSNQYQMLYYYTAK